MRSLRAWLVGGCIALACAGGTEARGAEDRVAADAPGRAPAATPKGKPTDGASAGASKSKKKSRPRATARRQVPPEHSLPFDHSRLPRTGHPHVQGRQRPTPRMRGAEPVPLLGWGASLLEPQFEDRTRRPSQGKRPPPLGDALRPGERFRYDVFFSGNPTGMAEAGVVSREPDPDGGPPLVKLHAFARTSGVVALLTTITYELEHFVDAATGAPVRTTAQIKRDGLPGRYKRRETSSRYMGRGYVEIVDRRDDRTRRIERTVPVDTFDSLATMAWVRALDLEKGETAKIYALDGRTLLRVDITGRGLSPLESMPTIGTALGVDPAKVYELEGVITRVDSHGAAIPGKRTYSLRVWVSGDDRRIPLMLESDMWLGVIRLILTQYDPPDDEAKESAAPRPK